MTASFSVFKMLIIKQSLKHVRCIKFIMYRMLIPIRSMENLDCSRSASSRSDRLELSLISSSSSRNSESRPCLYFNTITYFVLAFESKLFLSDTFLGFRNYYLNSEKII